MVLRPVLDDFLDAYPTVSARLLLLDRSVNLIDEGFDIALRIGQSRGLLMMASRIGEVRRVVVAAPRYLKQNPRIAEPAIWPNTRSSRWRTFPIPGPFRRCGIIRPTHRSGDAAARHQQHPRRGGVGRRRARRCAVLSYQVAEEVRKRRARSRARGPRARRAAGACDRAARPAHGAEGARLHGFCGAEAAQAILRGWRRTPAIGGTPRPQ
jgi:hypothetical protein